MHDQETLEKPCADAGGRTGTQSIERTVRILTALAMRSPSGWRLPDLARQCDLDKGTVRRILSCLVRERFAQHRLEDQRYLPGPMLFELGLALPQHGEFQRAAINCLEALPVGRDVGRFLCFRSGLDLVCAGRIGLAHAYSLHVGARRPLASSVAGIAMIVALPREQADALFSQCMANQGPGTAQSLAAVRRMYARSIESGMGINEGFLTPGWNSYAIAVHDECGEPFASLMVTAGTDLLSPARVDALRKALEGAAQQLQVGDCPPRLHGLRGCITL